MRSIVILFEDQLSLANPVFKAANRRQDVIVLVDSAECTDQKARRKLFRTRAIEAFADELRTSGWEAHTICVDRREGRGALGRALKWCANDADIHHLIAAEPGDFSMRTSLERLAGRFRKPVRILNDHRFICSRQEFAGILRDGRSAAEFYQSLRHRESLLMDGSRPEGGRWRHIDGDAPTGLTSQLSDLEFNRPAPDAFQAKRELERFIEFTLPRLGPCEYLDPSQLQPFPSPEIETMLDAGLLSPLKVCHRIEGAYRDGKVPLHAAEHAIYRIVGLREFRRGLIRLGEVPAEFDPRPAEVVAFREAYERREAGLLAQRRLYSQKSKPAPLDLKQEASKRIPFTHRIAISVANSLRKFGRKVLCAKHADSQSAVPHSN